MSEPLPAPLRALVARAWEFRWQVEREAQVRFARLSRWLSQLQAPAVFVELAERASRDEARHAQACAALAVRYGAVLQDLPARAPEIAPRELGPDARLLYELVAACCVTETESVSVVTTLLDGELDPAVEPTLREIARDEVVHSRLGWGYLAHEAGRADVGYLAPLVPFMLEGAAPADLFAAVAPEREDPRLRAHGVLTHGQKRHGFVRSLEEVIFPGLSRCGIDTAPSEAWLHQKGFAK